ncbi:MAG TPA: hypothetical protein VK184_11250 [Nostocaceae cyanobacterium]|nr:hypothetical protein [Nostocaceae cyanobacterium]
MRIYLSTFALNSLFLIFVFTVILLAKIFSPSVGGLFLPPPAPQYWGESLLTHAFQILCCIPPVVCTFSYFLLRTIQTHNKNNQFILFSALLTTGFLINQFYRIHIILYYLNIPKLVTVFCGTLVAIYYGVTFRQQIKSTPYFLLFTALGLLFTAVYVDSLHLSGDSKPILLEGVPKLFSSVNLSLYFWFVCYDELKKLILVQTKSEFGLKLQECDRSRQ